MLQFEIYYLLRKKKKKKYISVDSVISLNNRGKQMKYTDIQYVVYVSSELYFIKGEQHKKMKI